MSNKFNYTNYAAIKPTQEEAPVEEVAIVEPEVAEVVTEEVIEEVAEVVEEPTVEEVVEEPVVKPAVEFKPSKLKGVVVDCDRLNVRKGPSATNSIVGVLIKGDEVTIEAGGNKTFYEISTPNVKGYCMKQYIKITN